MLQKKLLEMTVKLDKSINFDITYPVVIVGGGAAGLTAALATRDEGVEVLVLERDNEPRGTTSMSQGNIAGAGTKSQKGFGIDDSGEIFAKDIINLTKGETDHSLAKFFANESGKTIDWLVEKHGIPLELDLDWGAKLGHSKPRIHCTPSKTGIELMTLLTNACSHSGVDILTNAHVIELFINDKKAIIGLKYKRPDGSTENVGCNSLIIATSGFGGNREMIKKFIPEMANAIYHGHEGNDGAGINWGIELGAATKDMTSFQGLGALSEPSRILIHYNTILRGGVILNTEGKRFTDESKDISGMGRKVSSQPNGFVWFIFDEKIHNFSKKYEEHKDAIESGTIKKANSPEDLSDITKIPLYNLNKTLEDLNKIQSGSMKDPFGRVFDPGLLLNGPPWFTTKCVGALFHTQGGLVINECAEVIREDGTKLPNLYAAGGTARSISGPSDWGYIPAAGLFTATTQGRIAGKNAGKKNKIK